MDSHLLPVYPYELFNLTIDHGVGAFLFDSKGNRYVDCNTGNGANVLGVAHSRIIEAVTRQIKKISHTGNYFYNDETIKLAKTLADISGLEKVFFSNSGAESVEAAIKAARKYGSARGKFEIIVLKDAWHGRTLGTISASGNEKLHTGYAPLLEGFKVVPNYDLLSIKNAVNEKTVAVLIEPILGHGGVVIPETGFFKSLREFCTENKLLLILDEVQTGVGRTGDFFRFQSEGIVPDIVTLGKGLGGGLPIGATIFSKEVSQCMSVGDHGATTGGNPLSTAVASVVIDEVISQKKLFTENSLKFKNMLDEVTRKSSFYTNPRGIGHLWAVDVGENSEQVLQRLKDKGVLATRVNSSCIRFLPSYVFCDDALEILRGVLSNTNDN